MRIIQCDRCKEHIECNEGRIYPLESDWEDNEVPVQLDLCMGCKKELTGWLQNERNQEGKNE